MFYVYKLKLLKKENLQRTKQLQAAIQLGNEPGSNNVKG